MTTERTQVQVTKSSFTEAVNSGLTKAELAEKFGISKLAVAKFAKDLDLKVTIKRKGNAKYILVDDAEEMTTEIPVSNYSTF
jgi:hypothetical protein